MHCNMQHISLLAVVSANPALLFQPLHHQRNVCHQGGFLAGQTDEVTRDQVWAVRQVPTLVLYGVWQ
jgi:hypothetical protein